MWREPPTGACRPIRPFHTSMHSHRGEPFQTSTLSIIMKPDYCIDVCNRLLRGERSAVETYEKAIEKYGSEPAAATLRRIRDEHVRAVATLEENVRSMAGEPDREAGPWGAFANTVQSAANLFGTNSALEALETGEKAGKNDYESALEDEGVMSECKQMIRSSLLPKVNEHIDALNQLQIAA
jgi:uncharacterized protein (TIGR02284 family)